MFEKKKLFKGIQVSVVSPSNKSIPNQIITIPGHMIESSIENRRTNLIVGPCKGGEEIVVLVNTVTAWRGKFRRLPEFIEVVIDGNQYFDAPVREVTEVVLTPAQEKILKALEVRDAAAIRSASSADADMNFVNEDRSTPLFIAASNGDEESVAALLELGADPDAQDHSGETALMSAASAGHLPVVQVLLKAGARTDIGSKWGTIALDYAQTSDYQTDEIIRLLEDPSLADGYEVEDDFQRQWK